MMSGAYKGFGIKQKLKHEDGVRTSFEKEGRSQVMVHRMRREGILGSTWAPEALEICTRSPNLPKLVLPQPSEGLHMPDVELDALCESIFASLDQRGLPRTSVTTRSVVEGGGGVERG